MQTPLRVLLVEDSPADAELLEIELERAGLELTCERVDTASALKAALAAQPWQLVLADYQLPGFSAGAALEIVMAYDSDIPVIIVSGAVGEDTAVSSLHAGAADFIMKGNLARLAPAITRELRQVEVRRARLAAEQALRRSEEFHRLSARRATELYAEAERARADAEHASRAKSEFIAVMGHELRTPLTSILGYTELLRDETAGSLNSVQKEELERIDQNGRHLLMLIDNVLDFGVISAGRTKYLFEELPLNELTGVAEAMITSLARPNGITCRIEAGDPTAIVRGDPTRVRQILWNLLANAIKFTSPSGTVVVSATADSTTGRIQVADTGCGIPRKAAGSIFDAFSQADTTATRRHGGVGLGLTISRALARAMGGDVVLEETSEAGSRFALVLPRVVVNAETAVPAEILDFDRLDAASASRARRTVLAGG